MMRKIFKNSKGNLVDLGEVNHIEARRMLRPLHAILDEMRRSTNGFKDMRAFRLDESGRLASYAQTGRRCQFDAQDLPSLTKLFSCAWFSRLWVFQEAALAPRSLCHLGSSTPFDLMDIVYAAVWLAHLRPLIHWSFTDTEGMHMCLHLFRILGRGQGSSQHGAVCYESFAALWSCCSKLECSDPRDKVYGMVGLHPDMDGHIDPALFPDYSRPVSEVLRDATRFALKESPSALSVVLGSIGQQQLTSHELELPSWVPPWYRPQDISSITRPLSFSCESAKGRYQEWILPAAWSLPEHDKLDLTGFGIDTVSLWGPVLQNLTPIRRGGRELDPPSIFHWKTWWQETLFMMELAPDPNITTYSSRGGFGAILSSRTYVNFMCAFFEQDQPLFDCELPGTDETTDERPEADHPQGESPPAQKLRSFIDECCNRRAFRTASGRFGLGPRDMRPDDIVTIIYGGKWPFILRPVEHGQHRIIGPCYLGGVMWGAAVQEHMDAGKEDVVFRIV